MICFAAKVVPQSKDQKKYFASGKKEIDGLINRGVFVPATINDGCGHRIYGSCIVDYIRHEGTTEAYEKLRLVAQAFNDEIEFMTNAPKVMSAWQRLLPSVAASDKEKDQEPRR